MNSKAGAEIGVNEVGQFPVFYILKLGLCNGNAIAIKIGKTTNWSVRKKAYQRAYGSFFTILKLRRFVKAQADYYIEDERRIGNISYVDAFERIMMRRLKKKITPLYNTKELKSSEYYKPNDEIEVLGIYNSVVKELKGEIVEEKEVKKTKRKYVEPKIKVPSEATIPVYENMKGGKQRLEKIDGRPPNFSDDYKLEGDALKIAEGKKRRRLNQEPPVEEIVRRVTRSMKKQ